MYFWCKEIYIYFFTYNKGLCNSRVIHDEDGINELHTKNVSTFI